MYSDLFQIDSDFDAQMFEDRFENLLAGWSLTLDVIVPNNQISDINSNGQTAC
jgi:hypothetical protein